MAKKSVFSGIKKPASRKAFWEIFHAAWGEDRGDGERRPDYDKKAWMYMQGKMELYFQQNKL